ncbi:MAG: pyridoxamine kinase [Clostridiales bacterium]|nr:pyridoxamine kinase [Clostridiales bacterium]
MPRQKRVAAIHDISCFGRCSLTVALPILSSAGIETSVIPTAVLSTHTGGFTGYTYRDLTDDILPVVSHWQTLNLTFDAVYTGFLGSLRQIDIISEVFDRLKTEDSMIVVDPVMADNGKLYPIYGEDFPVGLKRLCPKTDLIIPNITEACLLLGWKFRPAPYEVSFIEDMLDELAGLGPKQVVLTGVSFDAAHLGAASLDAASGKIDYSFSKRIEGFYHGTGDVFASTLVAGLLTGHDLNKASRLAVDFTVKSIIRTKEAGTDTRFGVNFEAGLGELASIL